MMVSVTRRKQSQPTPVLVAAAVALASAGPSHAGDAWPAAVHARYRLLYNGIDVGKIDFNSKVAEGSYTLYGDGKVSLLFGAIRWTGAANVSGSIHGGGLRPSAYAFDWKKQSKGGSIQMGYRDGKAADVQVEPPPSTGPEVIPLKPEHMAGPLDPMSAIMQLTRSDRAAPCDRRVAVFDGKHRYDIVFTYKRQMRIAPQRAGGASTVGIVCRAMYEPIAGYRADANAKSYAANRDAEVVLRPVPDAALLLPHSVTIPTAWGTGSMVIERIEVTSATSGQFALTE